MDLPDTIFQMIARQLKNAQLTDLQIGTVVKDPPNLEIELKPEMAPLKKEVLYLTEAVIEKKIPLLKHRHEITILQHSHVGVHGPTQSAFVTPPYYTEYSLLSAGANASVQSEEILCWENEKNLPLSKDKKYIILNRALEKGDKVLLLRVQNGQKFIVLSRIFGGDG